MRSSDCYFDIQTPDIHNNFQVVVSTNAVLTDNAQMTGYPEHFFTDDFGLDRGQLGLDPSDSPLAASEAMPANPSRDSRGSPRLDCLSWYQ